MATYVLLRVEDDEDAQDLLRDIALYPHQPLLTPSQENTVMVEIVPDLDAGDQTDRHGIRLVDSEPMARGLRAHVRRSYLLAAKLAAEWEAEA